MPWHCDIRSPVQCDRHTRDGAGCVGVEEKGRLHHLDAACNILPEFVAFFELGRVGFVQNFVSPLTSESFSGLPHSLVLNRSLPSVHASYPVPNCVVMSFMR